MAHGWLLSTEYAQRQPRKREGAEAITVRAEEIVVGSAETSLVRSACLQLVQQIRAEVRPRCR